ncbi:MULTISPECIES: cytidine deaminase [Erwinia]|uniref:Cytidine deaminase n=1 Tax=Erwinia rhapontici TaxID=55212 RepID=A0ABM7N305_ERWRD|nr:cytidine deaminase [Erwinia rhapontici]NKG29714.1 cytidine deaminase [Erwinia rhapontici]TDT01904.1 cytidine deaminase [Erwinia rhapontici]BCQ35754.1 cytidine deaminase [Erwinia rhapontici]BCQ40663.1 cytidine deaminase [Erwinia rhapontici]BCQ45953.1 cytidine deaminase [Erwinia rhapontici]
MHPRYQQAFATLPTLLQSALQPILAADDFAGFITASQAGELKKHCGFNDSELAFALLPLAAACAVATLSDFKVGAIARGKSGTLFFGANMEFAGTTMQQTVHAEQSAVTHAWLRGESALACITVNYTPCGHCRQFMNELNSGSGLTIELPGRAAATLGDYLPDSFGPHDLAITTLLMDDIDHGFIAAGDALTQAAINAASHSHAPYSKAWSGVALQTVSGAIFAGRYAENAAFNPSLPPLQGALNLLSLSGHSLSDIHQAVLAEAPDAALSQQSATAATLAALGCMRLTTVVLKKS